MSNSSDGLYRYESAAIPYVGMWGKSFFVDYDNGGDGYSGRAPDASCKHLQSAIDMGEAGDVVYIRPRTPDTDGGDPANITPASTTNWTIPYTKHGMAIIGTGIGLGKSGNYQTGLQGSTATTPVFWTKAPFTVFENINWRRGSSTEAVLKSSFSNAGPDWSFGCTVNNCTFWQVGSTATAGALYLESAWHSSVLNCSFQKCSKGIYIGASNSVPVGLVIRGCDFQGLAADVIADIFASGAVTNILIDRCAFNHAVPTGGSPNRYVSIGAASTGLISNCSTGAVDATIADNMTLNSILYSNIWGDGVGPMVDA
jgi:hypothetical protein